MASGAPASAPAKLHGYDWWRSIGSPRLICAPMVDQSELAFRQLTREFGCELAVTPMLHARLSLEQPDYLRGSRGGEGNFSTAPADRPLLAQFCGNDAATLLAAGRLVEREVDGIDLNLGCPQGIARRGRYGSFLLEETALLEGIVSALHAGLAVPVTCKIRILPTLEATLALARALERAGCSMLTVHGRTRANMKQSITEADWGVVRAIKQAVGIPVVANGSVACRADVDACLRATGCDGVMVSEALLEDPGLFSCGQPTRGPLLARRGGGAAEALGPIDATRAAVSDVGTDGRGRENCRRACDGFSWGRFAAGRCCAMRCRRCKFAERWLRYFTGRGARGLARGRSCRSERRKPYASSAAALQPVRALYTLPRACQRVSGGLALCQAARL